MKRDGHQFGHIWIYVTLNVFIGKEEDVFVVKQYYCRVVFFFCCWVVTLSDILTWQLKALKLHIVRCYCLTSWANFSLCEWNCRLTVPIELLSVIIVVVVPFTWLTQIDIVISVDILLTFLWLYQSFMLLSPFCTPSSSLSFTMHGRALRNRYLYVGTFTASLTQHFLHCW